MAPISRRRSTTSARWATRTSGRPRPCPTRCSRSRSRRSTRAGSRRSRPSAGHCSTSGTPSRTSILPTRATCSAQEAARGAAVRRPRPGPRLLRQVPVEPDAPQQDHRVPVLGPGRAAARQRRDRQREAAAVGGERPARQYIYMAQRSTRSWWTAIASSRRPTPSRPRALSRTRSSTSARSPGPAHPAVGRRPGLPGARPGPQEQPRADQGRRPCDDHHGVGAADGGHRGPALADQKLALDQITALNTTTENLIVSTSQMLREQSGRINEQAVSATVGLESCRRRSRTSTRRWTRSTPSS